MKFIAYIFSGLWKAWLFLSILIAILLLFPFILVTSLNEKWYPQFFLFARAWAWIVLIMTGLIPKTEWIEKPDKDKVYILSSNHTSLADILLMLALFPNCFLFIGKKELTKFPLFGFFYKRTNILVDRKSLRSRRDVFERAGKKIDQGIGVCIYPEGGVPKDKPLLGAFKNGAFKLSVDKNIPIIPITFFDNERKLPFTFAKGGPGILRTKVHPFLHPENGKTGEVDRLRNECFNLIEKELLQDIKRNKK